MMVNTKRMLVLAAVVASTATMLPAGGLGEGGGPKTKADLLNAVAVYDASFGRCDIGDRPIDCVLRDTLATSKGGIITAHRAEKDMLKIKRFGKDPLDIKEVTDVYSMAVIDHNILSALVHDTAEVNDVATAVNEAIHKLSK